MAIYQTYGTSSVARLNASEMNLDAALLRDNAAKDRTTYYSKTGTYGSVFVCSMWDLGTAGPVTKLVASFGGTDLISPYFDYSDDGTTWYDALTIALPAYFGDGDFAWQTDIEVGAIVVSNHRYWRFTCIDSYDSFSGLDSRVGDFRIYYGAYTGYVAETYVAPVNPSPPRVFGVNVIR